MSDYRDTRLNGQRKIQHLDSPDPPKRRERTLSESGESLLGKSSKNYHNYLMAFLNKTVYYVVHNEEKNSNENRKMSILDKKIAENLSKIQNFSVNVRVILSILPKNELLIISSMLLENTKLIQHLRNVMSEEYMAILANVANRALDKILFECIKSFQMTAFDFIQLKILIKSTNCKDRAIIQSFDELIEKLFANENVYASLLKDDYVTWIFDMLIINSRKFSEIALENYDCEILQDMKSPSVAQYILFVLIKLIKIKSKFGESTSHRSTTLEARSIEFESASDNLLVESIRDNAIRTEWRQSRDCMKIFEMLMVYNEVLPYLSKQIISKFKQVPRQLFRRLEKIQLSSGAYAWTICGKSTMNVEAPKICICLRDILNEPGILFDLLFHDDEKILLCLISIIVTFGNYNILSLASLSEDDRKEFLMLICDRLGFSLIFPSENEENGAEKKDTDKDDTNESNSFFNKTEEEIEDNLEETDNTNEKNVSDGTEDETEQGDNTSEHNVSSCNNEEEIENKSEDENNANETKTVNKSKDEDNEETNKEEGGDNENDDFFWTYKYELSETDDVVLVRTEKVYLKDTFWSSYAEESQE